MNIGEKAREGNTHAERRETHTREKERWGEKADER